MSASDRPLGKIGVQAVSALADRAAERIRRGRKARAVCVSPDGYVTVEPAAEAVPEDIAGTYSADTPRLELWRRIAEDVEALVEERPLTSNQRSRVFAGRTKREAA